MITFEEFLNEDIHVRMRHSKPQIMDQEAFITDLEESGYKATQEVVFAGSLYSSQSNFNQEKIDKMAEAYAKGNPHSLGSIVVTNDDYVVDGNHRWLACCQNDNKHIPAIRVNMTAEDMHGFLKNKPYTEKHGINQ